MARTCKMNLSCQKDLQSSQEAIRKAAKQDNHRLNKAGFNLTHSSGNSSERQDGVGIMSGMETNLDGNEK